MEMVTVLIVVTRLGARKKKKKKKKKMKMKRRRENRLVRWMPLLRAACCLSVQRVCAFAERMWCESSRQASSRRQLPSE
jgi:hypothetical protein